MTDTPKPTDNHADAANAGADTALDREASAATPSNPQADPVAPTSGATPGLQSGVSTESESAAASSREAKARAKTKGKAKGKTAPSTTPENARAEEQSAPGSSASEHAVFEKKSPPSATPENAASENTAPEDHASLKSLSEPTRTGESITPDSPPPTNKPPVDPRPSRRPTPPSGPGTTGSSGGLWLLGLILVLAIGAGAYLVWQGQQRLAAQSQELDALQTTLRTTRAELQGLSEGQKLQAQQQAAAGNKASAQMQQLESTLAALDQRVAAQAKRLLAMADTSREDWLLAEAEYLLKLANQRVRIERSAEGAEALLEEADAILRDLDQPDLHDLRRKIAQDLAALRLTTKIDVEGIYLTLVALAEQVTIIPYREAPEDRFSPALSSANDSPAASTDADSALQKLQASWQRVVAEVISQFRITEHDEKRTLVLAPDDVFYLQQNLRLIIERAQLALLREQQDIFSQSIQQADKWVAQYYPESETAAQFRVQLQKLADKNVVKSLPDISGSLNALHEYIEVLHKLKGGSSTNSSRATNGSGGTAPAAEKSVSREQNAPVRAPTTSTPATENQ